MVQVWWCSLTVHAQNIWLDSSLGGLSDRATPAAAAAVVPVGQTIVSVVYACRGSCIRISA